ncbi:tRNA amino-acyl synthetase [Cellulophaga lytica]|uniref:tRNA amino-acyl synthetase n=1 Tax=Cellulophaga lytica TaxID=979 RepID=UPI0026E3DA46|nr:tRNA amino-acyl synthetase [Cellulophaga lytica]MDO6852391.1 tRNA amino-acyl synthetase [Cellulophaga lytica]
MTILFISNRPNYTKEEALKQFTLYTEFKDFHMKQTLSSAKEFLEKKVIGEKKHLDFIISDWKFGVDNVKGLLNWLRKSEHYYSSDNFQFKAIPFLLIEDRENQSLSISDGFNAVIQNFPNDYINLKHNITSSIKKWRTSFADDLELIGLDPKTKVIYHNHRNSFLAYYRLKVISRKFVDDKSKSLNYIWTNNNIKELVDSNEKFEQKMKATMIKPTKYLEKEFHDFLDANQTFLKGENFSKTLYEKHLYINNTKKYNEADFINQPHEYALRYPEIFEVKRQSQRIFWKNKDRILSKAKKAFQQVNRYKNYMESNNPNNEFYIKKYLGKLHSEYEYTLLMGSTEEKRFSENLLEQLKGELDFDDINLMTYEDLLERHIRLCDRLEVLNIH